MLSPHKILFLFTLILGSLISISSSSWLGIWMGLEINLLSMIPLMNESNNPLTTEASIKYFIVQALASSVLLMTILTSQMMSEFTSSIMMESVLFTKMGAAPFHYWFPEVMDGLSWGSGLILMTWQKLAPMVILMYIPLINSFTLIIITASMMISGIFGINQTSLRKIMAFSSINHIGWMLSAILFNESLWLIYFLVYSLISSSILWTFNNSSMFQMKQFMGSSMNSPIKMLFSLNFLSLGGIPPFLGFFPKWLIIQTLTESGLYMTTLMMVILTLLPLYFYIRLSLSSLVLSTENINTFKSTKTQLASTLNITSILGLIFCTFIFNFQ
uniref:NADH-ubiquinone oxidoreductase chain 2 n=1 Tax=Histeroidea sp. 2 KM-2017 TaxID=2219435 RepID=A0A346RG72_9COLE|nr:NADH dehydrogenase subunit 2 [Histeroidea sp. 2 KM-2017]